MLSQVLPVVTSAVASAFSVFHRVTGIDSVIFPLEFFLVRAVLQEQVLEVSRRLEFHSKIMEFNRKHAPRNVADEVKGEERADEESTANVHPVGSTVLQELIQYSSRFNDEDSQASLSDDKIRLKAIQTFLRKRIFPDDVGGSRLFVVAGFFGNVSWFLEAVSEQHKPTLNDLLKKYRNSEYIRNLLLSSDHQEGEVGNLQRDVENLDRVHNENVQNPGGVNNENVQNPHKRLWAQMLRLMIFVLALFCSVYAFHSGAPVSVADLPTLPVIIQDTGMEGRGAGGTLNPSDSLPAPNYPNYVEIRTMTAPEPAGFHCMSNSEMFKVEPDQGSRYYSGNVFKLRENHSVIPIWIKSVTGVTSIELARTGLCDVSCLVRLRLTAQQGLISMDLSWNNIRDISVFSGLDLSSLETLRLSNNEVKRAEALSEANFSGRLSILDVSKNQLENVCWLLKVNLTGLSKLDISHNNIADFTCLLEWTQRDIASLQELSIAGNQKDANNYQAFVTHVNKMKKGSRFILRS